MLREQRQNGGLELPVNRASLKASRLLNTAAATLAASVLTDSSAEHYRAGFIIAPCSSRRPVLPPPWPQPRPRVRHAVMASGLEQCSLRRWSPAWWDSASTEECVPSCRRLELGKCVSWRADSRAARDHDGRTFGDRCLSACQQQRIKRRQIAAARRGCGARKPFCLRTGWNNDGSRRTPLPGRIPESFHVRAVAIPPIAAVTLATATLTRSSRAHRTARGLLRLTGWLGIYVRLGSNQRDPWEAPAPDDKGVHGE
jgi:hypothetical protein